MKKRTMAWVLTVLLGCAFGAAPLCAAEASEQELTVSTRLTEVYGEKNLMANPKASKVHDRVTIVINESTTAKNEATTDTSKDTNKSWSISKWFTLSADEDGGLQAISRSGANKPEIDVSSTSSHQGDGETERKQTFKSEISGEVVEVLPNGHLVIEARSDVKVNEEEQTLLFMGRIDPRDLDTDNTLDAKYVIDRRVRFSGKGTITDNNKRGWVTRILDKVSPF